MPLTPTQRTLRAQIAAHTRWANDDPVAGTEKARAAFLDKFEREVDPDGDLEPGERARRAAHARKAHFKRLAFKSAKARRSGPGEVA
ncbi:hypothetical protein [Actinospongicola halichondriae]|uniref:hypothetical protein n=1 Tax=Actinospongicola halichondriae TaxID=3236844 RepID=UPI003D3EBAA0